MGTWLWALGSCCRWWPAACISKTGGKKGGPWVSGSPITLCPGLWTPSFYSFPFYFICVIYCGFSFFMFWVVSTTCFIESNIYPKEVKYRNNNVMCYLLWVLLVWPSVQIWFANGSLVFVVVVFWYVTICERLHCLSWDQFKSAGLPMQRHFRAHGTEESLVYLPFIGLTRLRHRKLLDPKT